MGINLRFVFLMIKLHLQKKKKCMASFTNTIKSYFLSIGHLSKDHYQMAIFVAKVTHLRGAQMLDMRSICLRKCKEITHVFQNPHQRSRLVKVIYLIAGLLVSHFIHLLPWEAAFIILVFHPRTLEAFIVGLPPILLFFPSSNISF